jgi:hypothetical protein
LLAHLEKVTTVALTVSLRIAMQQISVSRRKRGLFGTLCLALFAFVVIVGGLLTLFTAGLMLPFWLGSLIFFGLLALLTLGMRHARPLKCVRDFKL